MSSFFGQSGRNDFIDSCWTDQENDFFLRAATRFSRFPIELTLAMVLWSLLFFFYVAVFVRRAHIDDVVTRAGRVGDSNLSRSPYDPETAEDNPTTTRSRIWKRRRVIKTKKRGKGHDAHYDNDSNDRDDGDETR